jgi:hypothetical protein
MEDFPLFRRYHILLAILICDAGVVYAGEFLLFLPSAIAVSLHAAQKISCLRPKKREDFIQLDV